VCVCVHVCVICIHVYVSQSLTPFALTISDTYVWEGRRVCGWVVLLCVCVCVCVCVMCIHVNVSQRLTPLLSISGVYE